MTQPVPPDPDRQPWTRLAELEERVAEIDRRLTEHLAEHSIGGSIPKPVYPGRR